MVAHFCQSEKKEREKEKKIKKKKKNRKRFFSQKAKQNKAVHKNEIKLKNVYWPIVVKMTPSTHFLTKDILTPHRYKATLRAHLTVN